LVPPDGGGRRPAGLGPSYKNKTLWLFQPGKAGFFCPAGARGPFWVPPGRMVPRFFAGSPPVRFRKTRQFRLLRLAAVLSLV